MSEETKEIKETKEENDTDETCATCLEQFDRKDVLHDEAQVLGCGHKFHPICVMKWIDYSRSMVRGGVGAIVTCPLCRDPTVCSMKMREFNNLLGHVLRQPRMRWSEEHKYATEFVSPSATQLSERKDLYVPIASTLALIEFGARSGFDVEPASDCTQSHLLQAVWSWHPWPVIEALLNAGANPDGGERYFSGRKPRKCLESEFYAESFALWSSTNAGSTNVSGKKRRMATQDDVVNAIKSGQVGAVELMIDEWDGGIIMGGSIGLQDVLHVAIETGNIDIVRAVVKEPKFLPVHVRTRHSLWSGKLHVDFATNLGHDEIAKFLATLSTRAV